MSFPTPDLPWSDAPETLLALAACDLDEGAGPLPRLLAHQGDEPLAMADLRPFGPGEALEPIVELLALLVPAGADRIAVALPARIWPSEDPVAPVRADGLDLRPPAIVLGLVDGCEIPTQLHTALHPLTCDDAGGWGWEAPLAPEDLPHAPVLVAIRTILELRHELSVPDGQLLAQLERVLALGHGLALSPRTMRLIERSAGAAAWCN